MDSNNTLINIKGVSYTYPGGKTVLDQIDFTLNKGDRIGLVAPNGSGKTTLFHVIMGLLKPSSGTIEIFGKERQNEKDFTAIRQRIGLLFQDADDQLFSPTVIEDVAFGPLNQGKSKQEALDISRQTLDYLGLKGFENRITFKLSGGEKRLVSLATILAMQPEMLLLDEPTNALDTSMKSRLISILQKLDLSYILISHEFDVLSETTHLFYSMENGKIFRDDRVHVHTHQHSHKIGKQPHEHV
jgi:cobalt/nickel transport system ATP-binding protein